MLKKALTFLFMFAAMAAFAQERAVPGILPKPTSVKPGNANIRFNLTTETKIVYSLDNSSAKNAAEELNRIAESILGKKLKKTTKATTENNIIFTER